MRVPIDAMGLALLITWVGSLQVMLDKGKDLDWFNSPQIVVLALLAVASFVYFLIWEIHEEHPIVDLSLFKGRNFTVGTLCMLLAYGVFFGNLVLLPPVAAAVSGLHRDQRRHRSGAGWPAGGGHHPLRCQADQQGRPADHRDGILHDIRSGHDHALPLQY